MKVGSLEIIPIVDGIARVPATEAVQREPNAGAWTCHEHQIDEEGRIRLDIGGFLLQMGDRTILVDAGAGNFGNETHQTGSFLGSLRRTGITPEDITDVVFTHMHFDHVAWSTVQGEVTFPNATFRVHSADWDHFMIAEETRVPHIREALMPIEERLEPFDTEVELWPGFRARPAPGHTPGTTIYVVEDSGERVLLLGDVVHLVGELTEPEWQGLWDIDREAAQRVRQAVARELEETGDAFAPAHFPELAFGRLVNEDGLRRFLWADGRRSQPAPL